MKFVLVSPFSLCNKLKEALLNINKLFWGVKLITCNYLEIGNWKLEIEDWRLQKEKANYHQTTNTLVISPHSHVLIIYYST